jgi:heat shock protein HslJ
MNKIALIASIVILAAGLLLSACAPRAESTSLPGSSWKLVSYGRAENQIPAAPGIETSLVFGTDGQVSGSLGCNSFSGNYEVKDGKLVFGGLASTLMACPEPQMSQEGSAFQVLSGTVQFEISGSTLTIHDAAGSLALTLAQVESK